ncbi:survival motor neuron protein 1-like isoform X2 [Caloenas nicobarica]|uniref:survival motor neuron protein 1-like isoform X2 n=1 Tax=Caloenas nicobarica TaxID=187106 RepID=UPI0032B7BDD3
MAARSRGHRGPDRAGSDTGLHSPRTSLRRDAPGEGSDGDSETPSSGVTPGQEEEEEEEDEGHQWRVGDACSVVWGGDGLLYPAHLRALDPVSGTCLVEFDGYGNTEERALAHLLPPCPGAWGETDAPQGGGPRRPSTPSSWEPPPGARRRKGKQAPRSPRPPEVMPPPWPPTPLRAMWEEVEEEEALTAMLMSWYMSGYHTGFYVGLREGRAEAAKSPSRPRHREKKPPHS